MRTRFPPSPTGFLHVGGLRTALYNYLLARQTQGAFLLRIEDTDQEREMPGAVEDILAGLAWAGLTPDEGMILHDGAVTQTGSRGPYIQSQRLPIYREHTQLLLSHCATYRCFCTPQRLLAMRAAQEAMKQAPMYDRACLTLAPEESARRAANGEPHVLRLKVPRERTITVHDEVHGDLAFAGHTVDDQVLLKSDGFPTYHLANVVDDHFMEVDLVLRGEEWLSSLPKHVLLYEAFGWTLPKFAHVPLLLNPDRTKLSKRTGSVAVREYITRGYLPEAMVNFLALLGWNPGTTQEVFSIEELVATFRLDRVQKAGAIFDVQKLDWLQGQWMRRLAPDVFLRRVRDACRKTLPEAAVDPTLSAKAALIQQRITFFAETPEMLAFFYREPTVTTDLLANAKQDVTTENLSAMLTALSDTLHIIPEREWTEVTILARCKEAALLRGSKLGQLLWPLRAALTGRPYSPGAVEVAVLLGKAIVMKRLERAQVQI